MADKDKEDVNWMYQGVSSIVNREDYLVGKKMDKNFELYATERDKNAGEARFDVLTKKAEDDSDDRAVLDLETVKKEDPLVAIKVREEKIRREIVDNPIKMKRLQKIVMSAMAKKIRKFQPSRSSASGSDDSSPDRHRRKKRDKKKKSKRNRSSSREKRAGGSYRDTRTARRASEMYHPRRRGTRTSRSPSPPEKRKRHDSNTSFSLKHSHARSRNASNLQSVDYSGSDSDTERRKRQFSGYGLVKVPEKRHHSPDSKSVPSTSRTKYEEERKDISRTQADPRHKLTEEEKEVRRREMMENAKWRDNQRTRNIQRHAREEEEDRRRDTKTSTESADFIRPMLAKAADSGSLEGRIKSKIHNLQRSHGSMNSHFARR